MHTNRGKGIWFKRIRSVDYDQWPTIHWPQFTHDLFLGSIWLQVDFFNERASLLYILTWIWGFWRCYLMLYFFYLCKRLLDTLTLPYNVVVQPHHAINKDVMRHPESFSISNRDDYIQQMLFNYTYYFYQTRFSTGLSILVTRHLFVVTPMNLLWYRRLKRYIDQWEIYPSAS